MRGQKAIEENGGSSREQVEQEERSGTEAISRNGVRTVHREPRSGSCCYDLAIYREHLYIRAAALKRPAVTPISKPIHSHRSIALALERVDLPLLFNR